MPAAHTATRAAYDALAPVYDLLTGTYVHERWLTELEALALGCGLRGRRLLDVACGTGASFMPLLRRGYEVTACDLSPEMATRAATKADGAANVVVADMCDLPRLGAFDLITCLDDAVNHVLAPADLVDAFSGMRDNLAPNGVVLFDATTPVAYAGGDRCVEGDGVVAVFCGGAAQLAAPGGETEIRVELFTRTAPGMWRRTTSRHRHRHHPLAVLEQALTDAGLQVLAVRGQHEGGRLDHEVDEARHRKVVVVAGPSERSA